MISMLGVLSLVILLLSVGALILHYRLLQLRGALDDSFSGLDELLRVRLEIIYDIANTMENSHELKERCIRYSGREVRAIIKSMPKFHKAIAATHIENDIKTALTENTHEIERSIRTYNENLLKYNTYVSKPPGIILAFAVGLKSEKQIAI